MRVNKIIRDNSNDPLEALGKINIEIGLCNLTHEETIRCAKVVCAFIQECKKMRSYSDKWLANEIEARKIRVALRDRLMKIEADELAQLESLKASKG